MNVLHNSCLRYRGLHYTCQDEKIAINENRYYPWQTCMYDLPTIQTIRGRHKSPLSQSGFYTLDLDVFQIYLYGSQSSSVFK